MCRSRRNLPKICCGQLGSGLDGQTRADRCIGYDLTETGNFNFAHDLGVTRDL